MQEPIFWQAFFQGLPIVLVVGVAPTVGLFCLYLIVGGSRLRRPIFWIPLAIYWAVLFAAWTYFFWIYFLPDKP